jgi:hypothetical protein
MKASTSQSSSGRSNNGIRMLEEFGYRIHSDQSARSHPDVPQLARSDPNIPQPGQSTPAR